MRFPRLVLSMLPFLVAVVACSGEDGASLAETVDVDAVSSFTLDVKYCGGPPRECTVRGTTIGSWVVNLRSARLERHRCVDQGADAIEAKPLSTEQLDELRRLLGRVRYEPARLDTLDGPMSSLTVTSASGTRSFSPGAFCGPDRYNLVVSGWSELATAVKAL